MELAAELALLRVENARLHARNERLRGRLAARRRALDDRQRALNDLAMRQIEIIEEFLMDIEFDVDGEDPITDARVTRARRVVSRIVDTLAVLIRPAGPK
jgi:hypothetical protein